ncbi:energy transducer TonB [Ruegeria sp. Ofav3-42]|uniref:energy transducer TonB n=1 Tax=Ruegeria sp. Ofav3-42 TaxID=2917759 RepID=UPI001EF6E7DD|nr:energy transducer TonB [Ruegeria sp. Ofav3-42]MCG7521549.1 TonB C-terminal domain-containing protein [Ruegeria sp. Ofav3-42]
MKRALEIFVFVTLSLGVHVLVFAQKPESGLQSGGSGGDAIVSIQAAAATVAEMVETWERPPVTVPEVQPALATPEVPISMAMTVPQIDLNPASRPEMRLAMSQPEALDEFKIDAVQPPPPPPPPEPEPEISVSSNARPKPRPPEPQPEKAQKAKQTTAGRKKEVAAGSGGATQAGLGHAEATTGNPGQNAKLQAVWGAKIRARIDRSKRFPRGVKDSGGVTVELHVSRDGKLLRYRIRKSSGIAALDEAAMKAVARAGRFPKAPKKLPGNKFGFSVLIRLAPR